MPGHKSKHGKLYRRSKYKKIMKQVRNAKLAALETNTSNCVADIQGNNFAVTGNSLETSFSSISYTPDVEPPHLIIATENTATPPPLYIPTGRRIFDVNFLFNQIMDFGDHSPIGCRMRDMKVTSEKLYGLKSGFKLECRMCKYTTTWYTDDKNNGILDVNMAITSGALAAGIGYSAIEEVLGAANIPVLSNKTYARSERKLSEVIFKVSEAEMVEAAEKEACLARELGDVDKDRVPLVPVIVDGSWAKRSYRTKYDSLSGLAVIIGYRTKKVLYLGVKNKYCLVCARAENMKCTPPSHYCYKNWEGSSSAMEASIVLEGFKKSEEFYGIRYNKIIADGDSSVFHKLVSERPYKETPIVKVECCNHLLRNLCKKLRKVSESRSVGTSFLRKLVASKVTSMRGAVNKASKHWASQAEPLQERIEALKRDVRNAPFHTFEHHGSCATYFCSGPKPEETNLVDELRKTGIWRTIEDAFNFIARHSASLIQRLDSNLAENFNSVVAKFIGGKRVNYCLRGSYQTRCFSALVASNSRAIQSKLNRTLFGRSPGLFTKKIEQRRLKKLSARTLGRKKRLISKSKGLNDYGTLASHVDMDSAEFEEQCHYFLQKLTLTKEDARNLEKNTTDQGDCHLWHEERRNRLTASSFGEVCKRRKSTKCQKLIERLIYSSRFSSKATEYGHVSEGKAIAEFEKQTKSSVTKCGLFVDVMCPILGASPDGLLGENALVEVKSPYTCRHLTPTEAIARMTCFDGESNIKKSHSYYYQIQGQLAITKREHCLLIVYTEEPPYIKTVKIERDNSFWKKAKPKLLEFYFDCLLPELVDPRKTRSMPIREAYICPNDETLKICRAIGSKYG